jgi:non-specific serine/threonine protein kinase
LRPYQVTGFEWLHFLNDFNWGGCLADDMGLGKTLQVLTLLQHLKTTKSLKPVWWLCLQHWFLTGIAR